MAQFEHGIYVPASHLPCGVNKGEISSPYFLLATCRWERWPWGQVSWPGVSPAVALGKTGPAPHLGTPVELSLLVMMQVSTHWGHKCRPILICHVVWVGRDALPLSLTPRYVQQALRRVSPAPHLGTIVVLILLMGAQVSLSWDHERGRIGPAPLVYHVVVREKERRPTLLAPCHQWQRRGDPALYHMQN